MRTATALALAALAAPALGAETVAPAAGAEDALRAMCAAGRVDVDRLVAERTLLEGVRVPFAQSQAFSLDLAAYAECRALQGARQTCDGLARLRGNLGGDACRRDIPLARWIDAVLRGGDADAACRDDLAEAGKTDPKFAAACEAVNAAARAGDPARACPKLVEYGVFAGSGDSCEQVFAFWSGKPEACAPIADERRRRRCLDSAALAAGLRDPGRCRLSSACLALRSPHSRVCAPRAQAFVDELCAYVAAAGAAARQEKGPMSREATETLSKAETEVKTKAEKQSRIQAAAEKKIRAHPPKPQFEKGEPMETMSPEVRENMKRIEKGLPPLPIKSRRKRRAADGGAPSGPEETPPPDPGGDAPAPTR